MPTRRQIYGWRNTYWWGDWQRHHRREAEAEAKAKAEREAASVRSNEGNLVISFTVPGEPVPQLRPRVVRNRWTNKIHSFTPDRCTAHAEKVRLYADRALKSLTNFRRLTGPLELRVDVYRERPKSVKRATYPTTRPDLSNYVKLVEDALNGLVWEDDSQVCVAIQRKMFVADGGEQRTEVRIAELAQNVAPAEIETPSLFDSPRILPYENRG
jgi:Holliday junction resolvase RusA-like endonuclease